MKSKKQNIWLKELRIFLIWYAATLFVLFGLLFGIVWNVTDDPVRAGRIALGTFTRGSNSIPLYIIGLLPFGLYRLIRSLVGNYKRKKWPGLAKGVILKVLLPITIICGYLYLIDMYRFGEVFDYTWDSSVENQLSHIQNRYEMDQKYRGLHVFNLPADTSELHILNAQNIEWIAFVPFIYQETYNKPPEHIGRDSTWKQQATERMERYYRWTYPYKFNVMLKPHIWLVQTPNDTWRSDIAMENEQDWDAWFDDYEEYMLLYATLAERFGFEMLCIGTELHSTVSQQPERWLKLIERIRERYSGKLTYAANWSDNLEEVQFWDQMDYIGIQAYFPISENKNPSLKELESGWQSHLPALKKLSEQYNKPILFTEIGYKSTSDAGITPWEWERARFRYYKRVSHRTQALCYESFFNVVWPEPWFAGAFLWQWRAGYNTGGKDNYFMLKDKPALNVIARGFAGTRGN